MSSTLPVFQGLKLCIQYMASPPPRPIFYPYISYNVLDFIRLTWSGTEVEEYTTHNCL